MSVEGSHTWLAVRVQLILNPSTICVMCQVTLRSLFIYENRALSNACAVGDRSGGFVACIGSSMVNDTVRPSI